MNFPLRAESVSVCVLACDEYLRNVADAVSVCLLYRGISTN